MKINNALSHQGDIQDAIIRSMYALLPVGQEVESGSSIFITDGDATLTRVRDTANLLKEVGALSVREDYSGGAGKRAFWKLLVSQEEALRRVHDYRVTNGTARPSKVIAQNRATRAKRLTRGARPLPVASEAPAETPTGTRLVASTGELPGFDEPWRKALASSRQDEGAALIEAARQYAGRRTLLDTKLKELRDAGIVVNEDAIQFQTDDRLETISLIVPYIDRMEGWVENLQRTVETHKARVRELSDKVGPLERENVRLRDAHTRAVADRVGAGALVSHGD